MNTREFVEPTVDRFYTAFTQLNYAVIFHHGYKAAIVTARMLRNKNEYRKIPKTLKINI